MFRRKQIYLDFSIKNAGFVFAVEICDLSVFAYSFYSIIVELSFVQRKQIYLDFSIKNAGFVFAVEICDLSVLVYNFYSIIVELSFVQRN